MQCTCTEVQFAVIAMDRSIIIDVRYCSIQAAMVPKQQISWDIATSIPWEMALILFMKLSMMKK